MDVQTQGGTSAGDSADTAAAGLSGELSTGGGTQAGAAHLPHPPGHTSTGKDAHRTLY